MQLALLLMLIAQAPGLPMGGAGASFTAAEQKLTAGDADAAIALYERGLGQLPADPGYAPTRAEVLLTIVTAHAAVFARSGDLGRLLRAKALLDGYLGPLDLLDEQGRSAAEDRRALLIEQIADVERARQAEAQGRAAAARRARGEAVRRRGHTLLRTGAAVTGLGAAGLLTLVTGLGLGAQADGRIAALKADRLAQGDDWSRPCADEVCREARLAALAPLRTRGNAGNVMVVVGAVAGVALVTAGAVLLVSGRRKLRAAKTFTALPAIGPTSLGLVLQGKF